MADRVELALDSVDKHSGDESAPLALGGKRVKAEKSSVIAEIVEVEAEGIEPPRFMSSIQNCI